MRFLPFLDSRPSLVVGRNRPVEWDCIDSANNLKRGMEELEEKNSTSAQPADSVGMTVEGKCQTDGYIYPPRSGAS